MCLHFPMVAINKEGVSLDMVSGPFKCHFGALTWPCGTLIKILLHFTRKKKERAHRAYWMHWCASWSWVWI